MSYQKSVALLSCCLLFTTTFLSTALASTTNTPVGGDSGTPGVNAETPHHEVAASPAALLFAVPPDTEGPTITITPPNDVNLMGCYSDFTYSYAAMGKPGYTAYDECGTATITETITDTYIYCADADDASPEGGLTIEREFAYEAVDCFGNTTNESYVQTITVTDNVAPSFVETLPADVTVDCGSIPAAATLTATDDCDSDASVSFSEVASTTCAGIVRTWVAVDDCGNSTTHIQNITVTDTDNPVITGTPADISQTADAGDCGAIVTWTAPTATDNCTLDTFTSTHNSGDAFAVGTTTVTYTATDDCGNSTSTSFDITITDDEDPSISGMPMDISQSNDAGDCAALVSWTAPTSADNCGVTTFTSTHNSGASFAVGSTTVTYTATDAAGNSTSASFTVTVTDDEDPAIADTPADIAVSNDAGECEAIVSWTAPTASDNCSATLTSTHSSGDAFAVGTTTVTYTATDAAGNAVQTSFNVVVSDDEDPAISGLPMDIAQNTDAGVCEAVVSWTAPTAADNCGVTSFTSSHNSGDVFQVGTTTVTYTASDAAGNAVSGSFDVVITDAEQPAIAGLPADIAQGTDAGACNAVVTWTAPTASDNCGVDSFTSSHSSGDTFATGMTTVTYTATDAAGNQTTGSFTVTVSDDEDPALVGTPADIAVNSDPSTCGAVVTWTAPTATDNCGAMVTGSHASGASFAVGQTTVTYTATDDAGNSVQESFTVTVTDGEAPAIANTPANISVNNDAGACGAVVSWTEPSASDNCSVSTFTSTHNSGVSYPVGVTTVTYTATDAAGNSTSSSFTVTVADNEAPSIDGMPADMTVSNDMGNCSAEVSWTTPTADDNCGIASFSANHDPMDDFPVGTTTVTYTATDDAGNTTTASFDITVTDSEVPSIAGMPADISLSNDASACAAIATWTAPTSDDNCGVTSFTSTHSSGDSFPVGMTTVTYSATDAAGNTTTASFTVTVTDGENPTIAGMPADISLSNDMGVCGAAASWTAPTSADNCGVASFTSTHTSGATFGVGTTTVTYTATDAAGNTATASFNVVVTDDEDPVISNVPANISVTSDAGQCGAIVNWTAPTSSDNCSVTSFPSTDDSGDFFAVGSHTVSYSAMDAAGNAVTASFTVTVTDGEAPAISDMPADITVSNDAGQCGAAVTWAEPSSTDNCGVVSFSADQTNGASFPVGTTTVTYTAKDAEGNETTDSFDITVTDGEDPVFAGTPADITVNNDAGVCNAAVTWTAPTATDNCGATVTSTHNPGATFDVGMTTVTYTATDAANNSVTTSFTVTVVDNENPAIAGMPADISQTNDATLCGAVVTWTAPTTTDNCGATLTSTHNPGDLFSVGTTTVTYTSTDAANNTATASFNVVVTDGEAPVFAPYADITASTDAGVCEAVVNWTAPTVTDNCGVTSSTPDIASGSTFSLGTTTVTYTASDAAGNQSTLTFDVIVEDNESPTITTDAADQTVECDGAGNSAALQAWLTSNAGAVATDNCSAVTWSNDFTTIANTCGGAGAVQVIFTATDAAGNTSTTSATFTIQDTTAPTIDMAAADATVECDGMGNMTELNAWLNNNGGATASETCSNVSWSHNYGMGASLSDLCGATGAVTVTFTATDVCGNASNTSATFTIEDTTNPTAAGKDHTVTLDAMGNGSMVAADIDNMSSDGCGMVSLAASQTAFDCSHLGANTVTLTVTDECNNSATTTVTVTVEDTTSPAITAQAADATYECDGTDYSAQFTAWLANNGGATATDACGPLSWSHNSMGLTPDCGDSESETVTFTVTDGSGNTSTTTATFSVSDTTPPSIASAAFDVTTECDGAGNTDELNAWLLANGGAGEATDLCGDVTWSNNFHDFALTCAGSGEIEVIFTATDDCGNAATTTASFIIEDTTAPELTAAATDMTVECDCPEDGASPAGGYVYAMGHEDWSGNYEDAPENGYSSFYRYVYNADGTISDPQLMFRLDEFDQDLIDDYYFSGYDRHPVTGVDYFVVGDGPRALLTYDIETDVVTDTGVEWDGDNDNYGPDAFTFSNDGTCYAWINYEGSGEIQTVDLSTGTMTPYITINQGGGAKALTYDYDNNRLLLGSRGNGTHKLGAIDLATGTYTLLHNIAAGPSNTGLNYTTIMGLEYIGNGMCLVSGGWRGHDFGQLDVAAGTIDYTVEDTYLVNPDQPALKRLFVPMGSLETVGCNASDLSAWLSSNGGATAEELCGNITWTHDFAGLSDDCGNTGSATVTFTASDDCGNSVSTTATYTIEDTTSPTALGSDLTVTLDGNGQATITADDIDNGSSDACGEVTLAIDVTSFDCDDVGPNDVVLTVTDECMNAASATVTVVVTAVDDSAPTISDLPSDISQNNDAGSCGAVVTYTMPSFQDNCAGGSIIADHPSGSVFPVGETTVTFTATDPSGNDTTATFTVTVLDAEAPTFSGTPMDITQANDMGDCGAAVTWTAPTADDNCGVTSLTSTHNPGDDFPVGTTTVTYTATDAAGLSTTTSFDVTVTDDENPAIAGMPADITQTADADLCSAVVTYTAPTASDNCGVSTFTSTHNSGDTFAVGTTTVTYTATDAAGNTVSASFDVIITDNQSPAIADMPANITVSNDAGQCGAAVTWMAPSASDNCGVTSFTSTDNSGDTFPVGTTTVTYTAMDAAGNTTTASFTITVTDSEAPAIASTPEDITQTNDAGDCSAAVTWTAPTASDNCAVTSFTSTHNPGATFAVGMTTVTYTAVDAAGNTTTSSFTVTVTDDELPSFAGVPADINQANDMGLCSAVVTWTAPTADDNCDIASLTSTHNPGDTFAVGTTTVTYTATDIHGNVNTTSFDVDVDDTENPVFTTAASDLTVECDGMGNLTDLNQWLADFGGSVADDNCGVYSVINDYDVANMTDACGLTGATLVTFTATDIHGNTSTTSASFIIEDTTPPTFMPQGGSEVVECDGSGNVDEINAWLAIWQGGITVMDECGGVSVTKTTTLLSDDCAATGEASITWTASDDCGNVTDTTLTFTIVDTTPPAFLTQAADMTVECDGAGNLAALQTWLDNHGGATADDVCGDFTWSNNFTALSDDCGATGSATVEFYATDECGNVATSTATFTIEDTTDPAIASPAMDMTVECDGLGNTTALNNWLAANGGAGAATDACGGVTWSNDFTALSDLCGATGAATVIFTATDDCGNTSTTSATFTIEDTTDPAIASAAMDMTVECDGSGNTAQLNAWLASNGGAGEATDACSDPAISAIAMSASPLIESGPNNTWPHVVTLTTSADATSGNQQTLEINVTSLPGGGANYRVVKTVANGNWFQANPQPLSLGMNTITVSGVSFQRSVKVQFSNGDVEFDALAINGEEQMAPTLSTGTSDLFAQGPNATWTHVFTATTAADPSSGDQQTVEINVTSLPSGGANYRVAKTVANGNWFFGNAQALSLGSNTITVSGVSFQRSVKIQLSSGDIEFDSLVLNGAEQVSGGVTWSNDFTALSDLCGATGAATVIFTATDACGNTSTTSATFTIEDTTVPSIDIAASDLTVECDGAGNPTELNDWLNSNGGASASDDCSGVTWSHDFTALSDLCGATGAATVTFTATDDCGLSSSTTATFTIEDTTAPVLTGDEVVIIDCAAWPWDPLYQPTIDELLTVVDTAGNPIITLDEACGYTNFPIDFGVMSGGCNYDHQLIYYPIDDCGNEGDSLYQVIQVDDYTEPTFNFIPADTMIACTEDASAYFEWATAIDACDPSVDVTYADEIIPTACPEEYAIRRTFYAEDCGYNIAEAVQTITIADTAAPALTLTAPADMALNGCLSSADISEAVMGSVTWSTSDDCGAVSVSYTTSDAAAYSCTADDANGEGSHVVTRTFTVTATDCAGNSTVASIDQTITITDNTAPTVSLSAPADVTVYLDAACYAAPVAEPVSGDASGFLVTASDDCDSDIAHTLATTSDDTTYTGIADGVGSYEILRTYTVTVTDDCGNNATATTSHTISVLDTISPAVTPTFPADLIVYADDENGYFDPTPLGTGGPSADYSDNCSGEGDQTYGVAGQVPTGGLIITAIADPNDDWSTCRFVEIHNSGDSDIDLTGYALQRWTNGNSGPSTGSNIDLSSIGTLSPGEYAWIANNAGFSGCYGFEPTIIAGSGGPADSNGDDNIAIIDGASNIIDMFGVAGEDGSNTCHEFEDGIALRAGSNTDPNGGAWDESGWIVYSDGSSASGCTNHNSNQPQNASDIALLINNWAGAGPAAPETDFNSVDISFSDVTTSYTATACYTFERTWTITVTDNNGNATTVTDVQTIQVADTSAPDITALENTTASCDLFGFDLSAGDQSSLVAGTSFELATSGGQYVDTGDASEDHALDNNAGQSDVNFTAAGGELGFASYYYATGGSGLTDGDFVGATGFTGVVGAFTDGSQGFQMQDTDGIMEVVFDNVDVSQGGVTLSIDYFPQSTGWETADRIRIWVVADGGEIDLVDTDYEDIDGLGIEGMWNTATLDLDGFDDVTLHVSLESNSGSEGLFIDNIAFTTGNSPLAALEAAGYVSFSDNVELASTEAAITLDGTPCEGAYDIVYTATDSCGNSATATQRIVLEDTEDPVLTVEQPDNVMMAAGADCNADYIGGVAYPMASATDNCDADVEITSYHVDSPKQYHCLPSTGSFTVLRTYTFTATDNCGNTHTVQVQHTVTVMDETAPTFTATAPADLTVNIDPFCGANTSTTIGGLPTVTDAADNCDATVDIDIDHTDGAPVYSCDGADGAAEGSYSFVRTFTITATDDCGNATVQTVTQTITALDITAPTITALAPMAAEAYTLDADCMADLTPTAMPVAAASDACDSDVALTFSYSDGAPNYTCDNGDGSAEGSFSFVRTWTVTATDDCGNMTTQQTNQTVVVTDDADPTLTPTWPADYTTDLDAECNADLTPAAAGAATATADDACDSDVAIEITSEDGAITYMAVNADDAAEGGYTFVRTWTITATDDCGNATTMTHDQTITANDVTAPAQALETLPTYSVEGCYGDVDLDPSVTGTPMVTAEDGCDSQVDIDLSYSTDDMVFNQVVGNYSLVIDTISGPEEGVMGMTTVRMYIETENADDFISAVAGDEINPTAIRTTTAFYQNVLGGPTANNYNDGLTLADPLVAYDSFVTIGIDAQADGAAGEQETTVVGNWAASFETGGDVLINDFFGGSWFTTSPNSAAVAGADHRVLLGQFTTDGQMSGQMFVQVFPNGLGAEEMRISFTFGECAEDDDTPEGSYAFTRRWESIVTDDANNQDTAVTYQHIQVLDTEAPQLTNTCGLENGEVVAYDCPGEGVLDFDPVPVACDVTAIDNCDSEVNVNVFTESEGYIPTDAIRNYCAPTTPEALNGAQTCDDRAPEVLRLFNFPGSDDSFVMADAENLIQVMSDGSMHIELEVENADGTGGFVFTADYGAGQDWATWSAGGSNYKKDCAEIYPGESIWEDWVYFLMTSGTLEGTGMYAGSSFTLSHQPANGYYGMQMGLGANNKNTNYGGSAWFFWQGNLVVDGTDMGPMASSGDVFMDLDCCLDWSVEYFYTALDDCGNPTGFHYSETMSGDLGQDDPAVSGGHTEGPVDITSIGGIKEPIRITGLAPNPTNNQSQLSFLVNENMRLRVDLYTMEGTLVQELYEGNAVTGVQYIMDIDADGLSAGMYQVRISSNTYLAVKKLLVSN